MRLNHSRLAAAAIQTNPFCLFAGKFSKAIFLLPAIYWLFAAQGLQAQTTWYVNAAAAPGGNGTTWASAFKDVQPAINAASSGHQIWVAAGTYVPTAYPTGCSGCSTNRDKAFHLKNGVKVYGGFPNTGNPGMGDRDPDANPTILSGDFNGDDVGFTNNSENAYHVVFSINDGSATELNGFTIRGGNANNESSDLICIEGPCQVRNLGGGMVNSAGTLTTIRACKFLENYTQRSGGGMLNTFNSSPSISDCVFSGNQAENGGGMNNFNGSSPTVVNCAFWGNEANFGAAVRNHTDSDASYVNCSFSGNDAGANNGAMRNVDSDVTLKNCILWGNSSEISMTTGTTTVSYSIVQGGYAGTDNLDVDPLFVQPPPIGLGTTGDLRLQACSPALDAGLDADNSTTTDLDGNARKVNVLANSAQIDLGAYERQTAPTAICQNITVQLDANLSVTVTGAQINDGSEGCGTLSYEIDGQASRSFHCDDIGVNTVTLTVTDAFNNTDDCSATITVADDDNPCCTAPVVAAPTVTQPTCAVPTGTIVVNASGGTLEYSVNNGTDWQSSANFSGLAPGNYHIKVRLEATPSCETAYAGNPVVLVSAFTASTTTDTWTGCVSTDWHTAGNWADGSVPTTADDVIIPDVVNDPVISTAAFARQTDIVAGGNLLVEASGSLTISGSPDYGILNIGTVVNEGTIFINGTPGFGLYNLTPGSFTNKNLLQIGNLSGVGVGINNDDATFINQGGSITIDRCSGSAIKLNALGFQNAILTNDGSITIGSLGTIGTEAISVQKACGGNCQASFSNTSCSALINIVASAANNVIVLSGGATFDNNGGRIIENASGTSSITTNSGYVQNLNGGTFSIGTNTGVLTTSTGDIWTGCTSTDWHTTTNWLDGSVPTTTDNVNIPNTTNDPVISAAAVAKSIHVQTSAMLTNNADLTVNGFSTFPSLGSTTALGNRGTFENNGTLVIGNVSSAGDWGLYNVGTFNNNADGQITIDRSAVSGLYNQTAFGLPGIFNNNGSITIGGLADIGGNGLLCNGTFFNNAGGQITIDRSTTRGLGVWSFNFTNAGNITIGGTASVGTYGLENVGTFHNNTGGQVTIDRATSRGIYVNQGTFNNTGGITIGAAVSTGSEGIRNLATFNNNTGGQITIDRSTSVGIRNSGGSFTNAGGITIGGTVGNGQTGIFTDFPFNNNAGGQITIDRSTAIGLWNAASFTNSGAIAIGGTAGVGATGLLSNSTFNNNAGGTIAIDRATTTGLSNGASTFTNSGTITIGAVAAVGTNAISNTSSFNNSGCDAFINIVSNSVINNTGTFTNSGRIRENASGNSSITTNSGTVQNLNGGTFSITTNTGGLTTATGDIWTGCLSTDWHTAGNWFDGSVPTATDDAAIPNAANDPIISAVAVAKSVNVQTDGSLEIEAAASLEINGSTGNGLTNSGTVTNDGAIHMGNTSSIALHGLSNQGVFQNAGSLDIDRSNQRGIANSGAAANFQNSGTVNIGQSVGVGQDGIRNNGGALFANLPAGTITIDRINVANPETNFPSLGNRSGSTFSNFGSIEIGSSAGPGQDGVFNDGTFTNQSSGHLEMNRNWGNGIWNYFGGSFTNHGQIVTGNQDSTGSSGILNYANFTNSTTGEIEIDRPRSSGVLNVTATGIFQNQGTLSIGQQFGMPYFGINNASNGSFTNAATGIIEIDNQDLEGFKNESDATVQNFGKMTIGATAPPDGDGINNTATFNNNACGEIELFANFNNTSTFTNAGLFTANTAEAHTNSGTFTNSGTLVYPQGNPIPSVTNNEIVIAPTTDDNCASVSPAFGLGSPVNFNILGVFSDAAATISAGTYTVATNTFTPTATLLEGEYDFFVKIEDPVGGCTRIVPWTLTLQNCCPATGTIWYVNAAAAPGGNGASWECAFQDVQLALAAAGSGHQIWVAEGTYKPTSGTDRSISFYMKNGVEILGGFPNTGDPGLGDRDWVANETILSGEIGAPGMADNSNNIIVNNDVNSTAVLDGFQVSFGSGLSGGETFGGGMFNFFNASPTVRNCTFSSNHATYGGAVYNFQNCFPTFTNCAFIGNQSVSFGTFHSNVSVATLTNCSFSGNLGESVVFGDFQQVLKNCIIWGNGTQAIAGLATITNSIIEGGYTGSGNMNHDPLFVSQPPVGLGTTGDLRLQDCSPAIDAANDADAPADDFEQNARFDALPNDGIADMGAYEYQSPATPTIAVCQASVDAVLDNAGSATVLATVLNYSSTGCSPLAFSIDGQPSATFDCSQIGSQSVTLTATYINRTDACITTVHVQDNSAPTIACPDNIAKTTDAGQCTAVTNYEVTASDNCSYTLTRTSPAGTASGSAFPVGTTNVAWSVTDAGGNATSCAFTVTVTDEQDPMITCPANISKTTDAGQCSAVTTYSVTASDNCSYTLTRTSPAGTASGSAFPVGTTNVAWSVTDAGGNATSCAFTITVTDEQLPGITCPGAVTVTCSGNIPAVNLASVTATDNCAAPAKSHVGDVVSNQTCANRKTVTRTYKATDTSGNTKTCVQIITVFDDVKPTFASVPANVTVQCNSIPAVGAPSASDGCGGSVGIAYNGQTVSNQTCTDAYFLTRQWTATDACGNTKTATQRITVIDTQKPNFTSTPANITVQCDAIPAATAPAATDNCDATVAITYNGQTQTNGSCPNAYTLTRTWTAADNCGNTKTVTQRITVVDSGKPVFTAFPANASMSCHETPPVVGSPTASDGCGSATVTYLGQTTTSGNCPGNYQIKRTWRATDACGNSTVSTQTIQVSDTGAPVFSSTPGPLTIECGDPLPPLVNPTASDACGGYVHITFLGNVPSGSGCAADYTVTRTWRAEDLCGNSATTSQVITVLGNGNFGGDEPAGVSALAQKDGTRMPRLGHGFPQINQADEKSVEIRAPSVSHPVTFALQPNPTTDRIWLDLTDFAGQAVTVSIFSDLGQLIWENRIAAVIDLKLPISLREAGALTGIYTVSVRSASGVAAKRVVLVE